MQTATELDSLISAQERDAVRRPIESALTLPNRGFTSAAWLEAERDTIFRRTWVALCFDGDVPCIGDALPRELVGIPLLCLRGEDDRVRVFQNLCPYDGCPVVLEPQTGRESLRAPYHGWRYDLRGKLLSIPYWDGTPEGGLGALGQHNGDLAEVATAVCMGIVFVNLAPEPPPFEEYIAPLADLLEPWDLEIATPGEPSIVEGGPVYEYVVAANWKTYYENTCINVLHEAFVHAIYDISERVPRVQNGAKTYWDHIDRGLMALAYRHEDFVETYPKLGIPHLGRDAAPPNAYWAALFPNLHLGISAEWIIPILALPEAPDRTLIRESYYFHPAAATGSPHRIAREVLYGSLRLGHMEDQRIIEGIQRARASSATLQNFYAPFWDVMHYTFSRMVLDALEVD